MREQNGGKKHWPINVPTAGGALESMGIGRANKAKGRQKAKSYLGEAGKEEYVDWPEGEGRPPLPVSASVTVDGQASEFPTPSPIVIRLKKSTVVVILPRRRPIHLPCHAMPCHEGPMQTFVTRVSFLSF
jgi:hypothetical protein